MIMHNLIHFVKMSLFIWLLVLGSVSQLFGKIELQAVLVDENISSFFSSEAYVNTTTSSPLSFTLFVNNTSKKTSNVVLKITIYFQDLKNKKYQLVQGETGILQAKSGRINITSKHLFASSGKYRLVQKRVNQDVSEKINAAIFSTGEIPLGTYEFAISVADAKSGKVLNNYSLLIERTTPINIHLKSPGGLLNYGDVKDIYFNQPLFHWASDASRFILKLWKVDNIRTSAIKVSKSRPLFEIKTDLTTFQYPFSGVLKLVRGQTYCWQIVATGHTVDGEVQIESEVRAFRIRDAEGGDQAEFQHQLLSYLKLLMGDVKFQMVFGNGGTLKSYVPTGYISQNDSTVNMSSMNQLINKLITGEIKIKNLSID